MKNKFKVGDIVECVCNTYDNGIERGFFTEGKEYEILEINMMCGKNRPLYVVKNDNGLFSSFDAEDIKLSNPKPMRDAKGRFKSSITNAMKEKTATFTFVRETNKRISELEKEIQLLKESKEPDTPKEVVQSGFFEPKEEEKYYFFDKFLKIDKEVNTLSSFDEDLFSIGNCFRTEQDALDHLEYLKAIRRIKKYIHENGMSYTINKSNYKYGIYYDFVNERWSETFGKDGMYFHVIPYLSRADHCYKLIQDCASDLEIIKNYSMSHNF
jgi:hypothetical protein